MEPIVGPGGRYRARLELLLDAGNDTYLRRRSSEGRCQDAEWLVLLGEEGTARLTLGEGGVTLHSLGLAQGGRAILQAELEAGPGAPDWLPANATLRLFEGDRQAAAALRDRFIPLPGAAESATVGGSGELPLDQLFIAVGRSVARANRALVEIESPGGTALVTTVTVSVALDGLVVERGRAVVKPSAGRMDPPVVVGTSGPPAPQAGAAWPQTAATAPRSAAAASRTAPTAPPAAGAPSTAAPPPTSFVQFTLALAPGAPPGGSSSGPPASVSTGAPASSQSLVALPMRRK